MSETTPTTVPTPTTLMPTTPMPGAPTPGESVRERGVWPVRILSMLLAAGVALVGTLSVVSLAFVRHENRTMSFTAAVHQIQVSLDNGNAVIHPAAPGSATVVRTRTTSAFRTPTHSESISDGVLTVNGSCTGGWVIADTCSVDVDIAVAVGTTVRADSDNGNVAVTGIDGPVVISSSNGDLRVSRAGGSVSMNTDNGDVNADRLTGGTVTGHSDNGDVHLRFTAAPGRVSATSSNGDIRVEVPNVQHGYRVQASTSNGDRSVTVRSRRRPVA
jgi:hypothetical protein